MHLLEVKDLKTSFFTYLGEVQALRGVSFELDAGRSLGIVGESGSGKSVTALSIMGLLQHPGKVKEGQILFKGKDLLGMNKKEMRKIRGAEISMIFQDPMTSLNPVYRVGSQVMESILEHTPMSKADANKKAVELLELVGIPSPEERARQYPHEFSGGMRQRAMIAIALSCSPELMIADEPTTALDVTIQAQIIDLMKEIKVKLGTAIILITHDLGVVADLCDDILVMYGGMIMESGTKREIFYSPKHPYTMGLLGAIPKISSDDQEKLTPILGSPPDLIFPPKGCPFAPRCDYALQICKESCPPYFGDRHQAMCWRLHEKAPVSAAYLQGRKGVKRDGDTSRDQESIEVFL